MNFPLFPPVSQIASTVLWPALTQSYVESALLEHPTPGLLHHRAGLSSSWENLLGNSWCPGPTFLLSQRVRLVFWNNGFLGKHFIKITLWICGIFPLTENPVIISFGPIWSSEQTWQILLTWIRSQSSGPGFPPCCDVYSMNNSGGKNHFKSQDSISSARNGKTRLDMTP